MYYTKLQELAQLNAANEQRVVELEAKLAKCNQELALSFEEKDKLVKELKRLREHLVMMEETSTREAVAAEERETQLRKTVRMLEEKTEAATDTVVASSNQYQQQLAELTEKLELREAELEAITSRLTEREKSLSDTSKALSNLQIVLKDLSGDHEKELATYEEEMDGLRQDMQKATLELNAMKSAASEWDEERRFIEDTVAMQKEDLSRKDKIMEELENQIEELRHASAEVTRGSHRIDDTVLRQLFLSYFTANKDKQGEIALLLASVLEYPEEDIKKIQDTLQQNSRSWFSWMGAGSSAVGSPSITEQFIRFLEHESLAVRQQTGLPVESTAAHLPLEDSVQAAQPKSSADDLKSILES
uniref:GRIP domain-containing protein n=1 Tax=Steinernema glaseri TaxID=37863 RepID=A0A1I7Y4D6_9BILA